MTQDRIEQAAREIIDGWGVDEDAKHGLALSIAALIRREREDAARVERERAESVERHAFNCGYANGAGTPALGLGEVVTRLSSEWSKFRAFEDSKRGPQ